MNEKMIDRLIAILVGPGAMCRMTNAEAREIAEEIINALSDPTEEMVHAFHKSWQSENGMLAWWQAALRAAK